MTVLRIPNRDARRLWLWTNGLSPTPTGPLDVMDLIRQIGFLQIDTIRNVTRAHNHILWTRNQNYREGRLWPLLKKRELFEHFTHDASLIPMEILPIWQRQFRRLGERAAQADWYQSGLGREEVKNIRKRIEREGSLSTHAFETKIEGAREMWARPPHKKALDQMWYAGELATCHRKNFVKYYNLGERIFPPQPLEGPDEWEQAKALCDFAMDRLSMGTCGEVQRYWEAMDASDAKAWLDQSNLVPLEIEGADKIWRAAWGVADIEHKLEYAPSPTKRLRIVNPFSSPKTNFSFRE